YALERLAKPKNGGQYSFYYSVIKGFDAYGAGKAKSISGIKTPNASTIVFTLTHPTGDFLFRMSMPATGPIPSEVGKCFEGQAGKYGRDLVSTAGYMIKGMDNVDISSCNAIKSASGFDGQTIIDLVRNPTYGKIANHIVPDTLFTNHLAEFVPYRTPGDHGSVEKAKAAMKGSKYSTGSSGMCDASACKNVLLVSDTRGVDPGMVATIQQD